MKAIKNVAKLCTTLAIIFSLFCTIFIFAQSEPADVQAGDAYPEYSQEFIPENVEAVARASSFEIKFEITQDWNTGFNAQFTITNNGTQPIEDWDFEFDFDRTITVWVPVTVKSHSGDHYVLHCTEAIAPGAAYTFLLMGNPGNVYMEPANYKLNGEIYIPPTPTPYPTPVTGDIKITLRDVPQKVNAGAKVEITADFENVGANPIAEADATLEMPVGASLYNDYAWNTAVQPINAVRVLLKSKELPDTPPRLYVYGTDDFNNSVEDCLAHIKPMEQLGTKMSANILAGALYYDAWDPDVTTFYGTGLANYMIKNGYEIGAHTFHHSHMGLDLHMNSMWIGETTRRFKRGSTWGIPNTEQEQMMEITLGKYWNEIYFNRRMEGFRSPFLEFNIAEGAESQTKTPLRSDKWKVIGKSGIRYVCTVNEGPSGWPPNDIAKTTQADLDPRTAVPSWPPLCDEKTVSGLVNEPYTNADHNVHNILVGTQRCQVGGKWTWGTIFDDSFIGNFSYADSMNFLKRYTDRHYLITQNEIPHTYIDGMAGPDVTQKNIPLSFGLHAGYTNDSIPEKWAAENKKGNDWVADIDNYIKSEYPDAKNVTHKDVLDYYQGRGTIRWVINMPETPGNYTFKVKAVDGSVLDYNVEVKDSDGLYNDVVSKAVNIAIADDIAKLAGKGYTDVIFTVKGADGVDRSGAELDDVISTAQAAGLGVYCKIEVFKDAGMHTTDTLDHAGTVVADIAEPIDIAYREALKTLVATVSGKNTKGIILDGSIPSDNSNGPTYGYSDAMVAHFNKFFGTPPAGTNPQDPTIETDPLYWSIYTAAATDEWRAEDIAWLNYDIRTLANTYFTSDNMSNLGADANGVQIVDWLLCKAADGSDNTGVSSWDEWEAWGEFRRYMSADFLNEVASAKGTKPAYVFVKGEKDANDLQKNAFFGDATDPVEMADITRRPNILPDKWNTDKTDNINGIIYAVDGVEKTFVKACVELARRVDYWVAKGGNTNRGVMPLNEYRPENDNKIYGICVDTSKSGTGVAFKDIRSAAASANGTLPYLVIVTEDKSGTVVTPTPTVPELINVALNKTIYTSGDFAPEFGKTNLIDGNDGTVWGSKQANSGNQWFFVDLGKNYAVEGLVIKWFGQFYAKRYSIGISNDAKTWTLTQTLTNSVPGTDTIVEKQNARYVGILCTQANDIAYGVSEFEVYSYEK